MCQKFVYQDDSDYKPPNKYEMYAYTPPLTLLMSATLRRIAWAINKPMTITIVLIIKAVLTLLDKTLICPKCKDKSFCNHCPFNKYTTAEDKKETLAALNIQAGAN